MTIHLHIPEGDDDLEIRVESLEQPKSASTFDYKRWLRFARRFAIWVGLLYVASLMLKEVL